LIKNFIVKEKDEETRIDRWLKRNFSSLNQNFIEKNLRKGLIKINYSKVKANYKVTKNDIVNIFNYSKDDYLHIIKKLIHNKIPKDIKNKFDRSIIFENKDFIVINKWSDISTQGGSKKNVSIDDIIKKISRNYNLVHRLDKETSGLLIVAKNLKITKFFGKLFKEQKIKKIYVAICQGVPKNLNSVVKLRIDNKKKLLNTCQSVTKYKVLKNKNKISVILFRPLTGKTHQLRIVSKHLNCPIIGDKKYNKQKKYNLEKLKLNAFFLQFAISDKEYEFKAKLPSHFDEFLCKNEIDPILEKDLNWFLHL
jgi:23S rRNA pseudouridine955/2504/2580 synthase|tara:strand:- start:139 stop:1065 length:927 start_codon:yes stop_codon:yes gene_type:complete